MEGSVLTQNQRKAVLQITDGAPLRNAQEWFFRTQLDNSEGYGWGHFLAQGLTTTWGGTTDAIRGLLACGTSPRDPTIAKAVTWILEQQISDGSFAKRGVAWSSVEATSWCLKVIRQIEL